MVIALSLWACTSAPQPDVVLVTIDTLRWDAVGAYGAEPSPTPTLDRMADTGFRVETALSTAPYTLPSHSSMLTGHYPARHGVHRNGHERIDLPTVAQRFREQGWATGGFVSAAVLRSNFGLAQGFEHYDDGPFEVDAGETVPDRRAQTTVDAAVAWTLQQDPDLPVFLWVHLYDPHLPYDPASNTQDFQGYRAEVAWADAQVSVLQEMLRSSRARPTVFSVTSDHGDAHGEHGEETHGWFVYDATMRVPWILSGWNIPPGVQTAPVSTTAVAATLLERAGLDADGVGGQSLWHPDGLPARVFGESFGPWHAAGLSPLIFTQEGTTKYIHAPRPESYNTGEDPNELVDLGSNPRLAEDAERMFDTSTQHTPLAANVDAVLQRSLEALGYTDSGRPSHPLSLEGLDDPKDHPIAFQVTSRTVVRARSLPPAEGLRELDLALRVYPDSAQLLSTKARAQVHLRQHDAALATLTQISPETAAPSLASLRLEIHGPEDTLESLQALPDSPQKFMLLAEAHRQLGACDQVLHHLAHIDTPNPSVRALRGTCLLSLGRAEQAVPELEHAMRGGAYGELALELSRAHLALGELSNAERVLAPLCQRDPTALNLEWLGFVRTTAGRPEAAMQAFARAEHVGEISWQAYLAWAESELATHGRSPLRQDLLRKAAAAGAPAEVLEQLK